MRNLSIAILDGNLVRDPEMKKTRTNKTVTTFTVALNHEWGSKEGNNAVSYIQVEVWEKLAETCAEYLKKGRHVLVEGNLRQDRWQDDRGESRSRLKVVAHSVRFMGARSQGREEGADAA